MLRVDTSDRADDRLTRDGRAVPETRIETRDPAVTDDASKGFAAGSEWVNTSGASRWSCVAPTVGSASWKNLSAAGGGGATALNDLTDVTIASPSTGQYLRKSAGDWLNAALAIFDDPTPKLAADLNLNAFGLDDSNGNALAKFVETASANQYIELTNADSTFGQGPKIAAAGTGTDIDLRLSAKGAGQVAFQDDAQFDDNIKAVFGSGDDATISWNGTDLIIDPGTGKVDAAGAIVKCGSLGLVGSAGKVDIAIQGIVTGSTVSTLINMTNTYQGSTTSLIGMRFTVEYDTAASGNGISLQAGSFTGKADKAFSALSTNTVVGTKAIAWNARPQTTSSTMKVIGVWGEIFNTGGNWTSGTAEYISGYFKDPPLPTGASSATGWAGVFEGDLQVNTDKQLILSGSATAKGDDYLTSDGTDIRAFTGGTRRWATNADGFDIEPDPHVAAAANGIRYGGATTALGLSGVARNGNIPSGGSVSQAGWINVKVGASSAWIPYWT